MKSMELAKSGRYSLVAILRPNNSIHEYVVCSYYDSKRKLGEQWEHGHYFGHNIINAVKYYEMISKCNIMSFARLNEICTNAINFIDTYDNLEDFNEEYSLALSYSEIDYFLDRKSYLHDGND